MIRSQRTAVRRRVRYRPQVILDEAHMRIPFFPGRTRAATAAPLRRLRLPAACSGAASPSGRRWTTPLHGALGLPLPRCSRLAARVPPARMRAGRPRTRCNPQVRAFAWGGFWGAPACLRGAHAGGTPAHPAQPSGARALAGAGWLASPGMPSPVSGIRTPPIPLLTLWEQRVGG